MSIIDRLRIQRKGLGSPPVASPITVFLDPLKAGIGKSYAAQIAEGLSENPYVYRCADLRATAVASLEPIIYDTEGSEIPNHPLLQVLRNPTPDMSWRDAVHKAEMDLSVNGNAYMLPLTTIKGLGELWPISPGSVSYDATGDIFKPVSMWRVNSARGTVDVTPERMIHLHTAPGTDGVLGVSPLESAGLSVLQQTRAREWNISLMENGGKPSGTLESDTPLTQSNIKDLQDSLRRDHTGTRNAGRWMVLPYALHANVQGFNARDMDYSMGVTVSAREIAIAMGVPPELVGDSANKTYANAQEANKEFAVHTVKPLADQLYGVLTRKLAPLYPDIGRIGYDEQQIDGLRGDESAIITALTSCDFLTTNEKRRRLSYPDVPGGDEVLMAMGKVPLEELSTPIDQLMPES